MTADELRQRLQHAEYDIKLEVARQLAAATGHDVELFDSAIEMGGADYFNGYMFVLDIATLTDDQRRSAYNAALAATGSA